MPVADNFVITKAERQEYDPIPEGVYQVEISDVNTVERPKYDKPDQAETFLNFEFTILTDGPMKSRKVWKRVRPVINAGNENYRPSFYYTILTKALHQNLTEEEAVAVKVNALIGKQLVVTLDQKPGKDGKTYNNIVAFTVAGADLDPIDKSEPTKPKATEDRETTVKAIFATARKLYPTLAAAPQPKEALKKFVADDFKITVESWSAASLELLNQVYLAMKNVQADGVIAGTKKEPTIIDGVNIDDIPF